MTSESIIQQIKKKSFAPVYILQGEESFYIDQITDCIIEHALTEEEREFNQSIVYGKDVNPKELLSAVKRYPMGAEKQLVVLKEAQELKNLEVFAPILEHPVPTSIFVINLKGKKLDKRKSFTKKISTNAIIFNSDKVKEHAITPWINNYASKNGIKLSHESLFILAEYLGNDLSKLTNALEKLKILAKEQEIEPNFIEAHIGISKDYNIWELQDAIGKRNVAKANKIVNYFGQNDKAMAFEMFIGSMYNFFSKLIKAKAIPNQSALMKHVPGGPYAAKIAIEQSRNFSEQKLHQCIGLLHEYDLRKKGVKNGSAESHALLQEIVYRFLH